MTATQYSIDDRNLAVATLRKSFTRSQLLTEQSKAEREAARTAHVASRSATNEILNQVAVEAERHLAHVNAALNEQ